jgi:hypothetical protein
MTVKGLKWSFHEERTTVKERFKQFHEERMTVKGLKMSFCNKGIT